MTADIAEARAIIAALVPLRETMKRSDRAFLQSWRIHLQKHGDKVRVGRYRLHILRKVASAYGVEVPQLVEIDFTKDDPMNDLIIS